MCIVQLMSQPRYKYNHVFFYISFYFSHYFFTASDYTNAELAPRTWYGECGFACKNADSCYVLSEMYGQHLQFCCTNEGFCATQCFSK